MNTIKTGTYTQFKSDKCLHLEQKDHQTNDIKY